MEPSERLQQRVCDSFCVACVGAVNITKGVASDPADGKAQQELHQEVRDLRFDINT